MVRRIPYRRRTQSHPVARYDAPRPPAPPKNVLLDLRKANRAQLLHAGLRTATSSSAISAPPAAATCSSVTARKVLPAVASCRSSASANFWVRYGLVFRAIFCGSFFDLSYDLHRNNRRYCWLLVVHRLSFCYALFPSRRSQIF